MKNLYVFMSCLSFTCLGFAQTTIDIIAAKDNVIYEGENLSSNGAGNYLMAGKNGDTEAVNRRALLYFDIAAAIPANAHITQAELILYLHKSADKVNEVSLSLHRLLADWGEGQSVSGNLNGNNGNGEGNGSGKAAEANDATWEFAFFQSDVNTRTPWDTLGGDFAETASTSLIVNKEPGEKVWGNLTDDVQAMLDDSDSNFGWILIGDEENKKSMRKFRAREHPETQPILRISYEESTTSITPGLEPGIIGPFPNPSADQISFYLNLENTSQIDLRIVDIQGKNMFNQNRISTNNTSQQLQIDVNHWPQGLYFAFFRTQNVSIVRKFEIKP